MHYVRKKITNNSFIELNCSARKHIIKWRIISTNDSGNKRIYDTGVLHHKYGTKKLSR